MQLHSRRGSYVLDEKSLPGGEEMEDLMDVLEESSLREKVGVAWIYSTHRRGEESRRIIELCRRSAGTKEEKEYVDTRVGGILLREYIRSKDKERLAEAKEQVGRVGLTEEGCLLRMWISLLERRTDSVEPGKQRKSLPERIGSALGEMLMERYEEALRIVREVGREGSKRSDLLTIKLICERALFLDSEAEKTFEEIERRDGKAAEYAHKIVEGEVLDRDLDVIRRSRVKVGESGDIKKELVDFLERVEEIAPALNRNDLLERVGRDKPFGREAFFELGKFFFREGKYERALECIERLEGPPPFKVRQSLLSMLSLLSLGREAEAVRKIEVLKEAVRNIEKYGSERLAEFKRKLCIEKLLEYVQGMGRKKSVMEDMRWAEKVVGDAEKSFCFWRIDISGNRHRFYNKLGNLYFAGRDLPRAEECYRKALESMGMGQEGEREAEERGCVEKNLQRVRESMGRKRGVDLRDSPLLRGCKLYLSYLRLRKGADDLQKGGAGYVEIRDEGEYMEELFKKREGEADAGRLEELEDLGKREIEKNPSSIGGARILSLCAFAKFGKAPRLDSLVSSLMSQPVSLDIVYNCVLYAYRSGGDVDGMYRRYREMRDISGERSEVVFWIEALYLLSLLKKRKLRRFQEMVREKSCLYAMDGKHLEVKGYIELCYIQTSKDDSLFSLQKLEENGVDCSEIRGVRGTEVEEEKEIVQNISSPKEEKIGGESSSIAEKREEMLKMLSKKLGGAKKEKGERKRKKPQLVGREAERVDEVKEDMREEARGEKIKRIKKAVSSDSEEEE
jgi:pentatricopeptide repeat protein